MRPVGDHEELYLLVMGGSRGCFERYNGSSRFWTLWDLLAKTKTRPERLYEKRGQGLSETFRYEEGSSLHPSGWHSSGPFESFRAIWHLRV